MSTLVTKICPSLKNKFFPFLVPNISFLGLYSTKSGGPYTLIYIYGKNFNEKSIVTFGEIVCQSVYNGSNLLGFYIPTSITTLGNYSIQVKNICSQPNPGIINNTYIISNIEIFTIT